MPYELKNLKRILGPVNPWVATLVICLLFAQVGADWYNQAVGYFMKQDYPYNTDVFNPSAFRNDFMHIFEACGGDLLHGKKIYTESIGRVHEFADLVRRLEAGEAVNPSVVVPPCMYFPVAYFVSIPFVAFGHPKLDYLLYVAFVCAATALLGLAFLRRTRLPPGNFLLLAAACVLCSQPFKIFAYSGNMEGMVFILCLLFYFLMDSRPALSALALAMAASMKLYPGLLVLHFVVEKKYRHLVWFSAWMAALNLLAVAGLHDSFPEYLEGQRLAVGWVDRWYTMSHNFDIVRFNHSLINLLWSYVQVDYGQPLFVLVKKAYPLLALLVTGGSLWAAWRRRLTRAGWSLLLVALMVWLPFVSFDYTLIHLYIPFFLLTTEMVRSASGRRNFWILVMMGLIFVSKNYLVRFPGFPFGIGYLTNAVCLGLLVLTISCLQPVEERDGLWPLRPR